MQHFPLPTKLCTHTVSSNDMALITQHIIYLDLKYIPLSTQQKTQEGPVKDVSPTNRWPGGCLPNVVELPVEGAHGVTFALDELTLTPTVKLRLSLHALSLHDLHSSWNTVMYIQRSFGSGSIHVLHSGPFHSNSLLKNKEKNWTKRWQMVKHRMPIYLNNKNHYIVVGIMKGDGKGKYSTENWQKLYIVLYFGDYSNAAWFWKTFFFSFLQQ